LSSRPGDIEGQGGDQRDKQDHQDADPSYRRNKAVSAMRAIAQVQANRLLARRTNLHGRPVTFMAYRDAGKPASN